MNFAAAESGETERLRLVGTGADYLNARDAGIGPPGGGVATIKMRKVNDVESKGHEGQGRDGGSSSSSSTTRD